MGYSIAGESFKSINDLKKRVIDIRDRNIGKGRILGDDLEFLIAFFSEHDEWGRKSEQGTFFKVKRDGYGNHGFALVGEFADGEMISMQHTFKCLAAKQKLPRALLNYRAAARNTIHPDILRFRRESGYANMAHYHVDHEYPLTFDKLAFDFCQQELLNPLDVEVLGKEGNLSFKDTWLSSLWFGYHKDHAKLRMVTKEENLSAPKAKVDWYGVLLL
jgi:hypothetical protein